MTTLEPNQYTLCPHCGETYHEDDSHECEQTDTRQPNPAVYLDEDEFDVLPDDPNLWFGNTTNGPQGGE